MHAMIAFVAGATGYTGRAVVERLAAGGARAIAHVRPDSPRLAEWRERFARAGAEVDATPWQEAAMTDTLRRLAPAVVYALLGTTRAREKREGRGAGAEAYERVDYGLSALLLRAARACGARPRFVYLSAAGARDGGSRYMAVRARLERELAASGLPWYAARPAFITGGDREEPRAGERIAAGLLDGALAVAAALGAGGLRRRWASMDAATLARGLARLATDPAPDRVVGPEELRVP
jgi:uncharacterized protein YbjT (DUF2867 family)